MLNNEDDDEPISGPLGLWRWPLMNQVKAKQRADIALAEAKAASLRQPPRREDEDEDGYRRRPSHIF